MASARQCTQRRSQARVISQMTMKGEWLKSISKKFGLLRRSSVSAMVSRFLGLESGV